MHRQPNSSTLTGFRRVLLALWLTANCHSAAADELLFNLGVGPQPGSSQNNWSVGVDYNFFRSERSARQHILIGASYTYLGTDAASNDSMYAVSVYPQISLYPVEGSWPTTIMPSWAAPYFWVRFLGPSYISSDRLGDRQQAHNFAFQAQIGVGAIVRTRNNTEIILALSWKHFSNANLYEDNDRNDLPVMLNFGVKF